MPKKESIKLKEIVSDVDSLKYGDTVKKSHQKHMDRNTIVAQATPLGRSGIAVIRLSGPESFNYIKEITRFSGKALHHTIRLLTIYDDKNRNFLLVEEMYALYNQLAVHVQVFPT